MVVNITTGQFKHFTKLEAKLQKKLKLLKNTINKMV